MYEIIQEALSLGIAREKILAGEILGMPRFDFMSYVKAKKKNVSIIADCCVGGGNIP